ncbi:uncharacterized protein ACR2FA_011475 [Aphomia sociella]
MGIISSKDTRRISFENTFVIAPAIPVQKTIEDDTIVEIGNIANETENELLFKIDNTPIEPHDFNENDYWAHRIDHLKKEHNCINKIIESEYQKTITNTNKTYEIPSLNQERTLKVKPCFEWRAKIMQCYEENPHQPLMCSPAVQAFTQCVKSCSIEE